MSEIHQTNPPPSTLANGDGPGHKQRMTVAQDGLSQSSQQKVANSSMPHSLQNGDASTVRPRKPDILYGLRLVESGKTDRNFYKDGSWKGVTTGLSGSEASQYDEDNAVLSLVVDVDVLDKTGKPGNTLATWRDQPVDFEFGRDAMVLDIRSPYVQIHSKRLITVMEQMMDYYPEKRGDFQRFDGVLGACYVGIMHFYAEMKAYHNLYLKSIPIDDTSLRTSTEFARILDIGDCGDNKIADSFGATLNFGTLDISKPCDTATAYDIAALLRQFAPMYRTRAIPTLESLHLNNDPSIKYDSIWLLYRPGTFVYVKEDDHLLACVIESAKYLKRQHTSIDGPDALVDRTTLSMWHLYSDGIKFLRRAKRITIPRWDGNRLVRDLEAVPRDLYDRFDTGRRRAYLKTRGQKYIQLIKEKTAYRQYEDGGQSYDGYIIVDAASYNQHHNDAHQQKLENVLEWVNTSSLDYYVSNSVRAFIAGESRNQLAGSGSLIPDGGGGARFHDITRIDLADCEAHRLIEDIYILLPPTIGGFLLKTKSWVNFSVDNITNHPPIRKPNQLENELVLLNDEDKESLRTVLPKGERPIGVISDLIKDKGEGKVFLLHGPPGTGKTMTVECVANDTRRPLLALTAADIGLKEDSEAQLRTWFTLAAKWDAILLIDEADLFLERRREGDIDRNSLVTVFLRTMEYYQGVLFLTTNRPGHIDDSFISRITVPIEYPALQPETRKLIIEKLVRKLQETGTILVDSKAKQYLIDNCGKLNGRQLRNTLHNAVSIAEVQERRLQPQNIHDFIKVERHHVVSAIGRSVGFVNYVDNMGGRDEFARARKRGDYNVESIANRD